VRLGVPLIAHVITNVWNRKAREFWLAKGGEILDAPCMRLIAVRRRSSGLHHAEQQRNRRHHLDG
jgi:hypothetical protein